MVVNRVPLCPIVYVWLSIPRIVFPNPAWPCLDYPETLESKPNFANLAVVKPVAISVMDTKWSNILRFSTKGYLTRMLELKLSFSSVFSVLNFYLCLCSVRILGFWRWFLDLAFWSWHLSWYILLPYPRGCHVLGLYVHFWVSYLSCLVTFFILLVLKRKKVLGCLPRFTRFCVARSSAWPVFKLLPRISGHDMLSIILTTLGNVHPPTCMVVCMFWSVTMSSLSYYTLFLQMVLVPDT